MQTQTLSVNGRLVERLTDRRMDDDDLSSKWAKTKTDVYVSAGATCNKDSNDIS